METQVRKPLALIALLFAVGCAVRPPSPVDSDAGSIGAESLAHVVGAAGPIGPYPLNLLAKCDAGEIVGMLGGVQGCVYQAQLDGGAILGVTGTAPVAVSAGAHPVVSLNGIDGGGQYAYAADGGWRGVVGVQSVAGSAPISCSGNPTATCSISAATDIAAGSLSASDKTKLDGITAGAAVASVGATAPITSTGGTTPTIAIVASTDSVAGSMSAADKTKLDGITAGAAVATVTGSAPIVSSGGTSPAISITGATTSAVGSIKLANDFASSSTATTPVIGSLQSGEVTCGASTGMLTAASGASSPGITGNANNGLKLISPSNGSSFILESGGTTTDQSFSFQGAFTGKTYLGVGLGGASSTNLLCSGGTGFTGQCGLSFGPTGSVVGTTNSVLIEGQPNSGEPGTAGPAILLGGPETSTGPGANVAGWSGVVGGLATSCSTGTCTGGDAYVYGGTGTTANGVAHFGLGGTAAGASGGSISGIDVFRINPPTGNETTGEVDFPTGSNLYIGSTNAAVANGTNVIGIATGTAPSSCSQNACLYSTASGLGLMDSSNNALAINGTAQTWANGSNAVTVGTSGTGTFNLNTGNGTGGASTASPAGSLTFTTGLSGTPASGTGNGSHGGDWSPTTGNGGNGLGTSGNGGRGGQMNVNTGNGGNGVGTAGAGGAGGNIALNAGNGGTSTGSANNANGGTVYIDSGAPGTGGGGTAGVAGPIIFQENGTSIMELKASATNTAAAEFGIANGYNFTMGSITGAQSTGTNILGMKAGSAASTCNTDVCIEEITAGTGPGIWALFGAGGMLSQLASDVTGTHNSEQIEIVKSATQKRTTGVSQTVTSTMALNSAVGVSVDAICMARTITAGTAGAIGDMGKIHVEGLVTNPAGTSSLVGTTATIATQGAAASNPVASCVISGNASGQVIVTATGASNGAGLVLDWGIFVTLEQL